jgi:hypothetical protein
MYKRLEASRNWQHALTGERSMIGYLNRLPILLLGSSGRSWILALIRFSRVALKTRSHEGTKGLAILLKTCHTMLIKAKAGRPIIGTQTALGRRVGSTGRGLPRLIPMAHRKMILRGDSRVFIFWLSLFSIYRICDYLGKINIKTITKPGPKINLKPYASFVEVFFIRSHLDKSLFAIEGWAPKLITKSGPGVVSAPNKGSKKIMPIINMYDTTAAMLVQGIQLVTNPRFVSLFLAFKELAEHTGQLSLVSTLERIVDQAKEIPGVYSLRVKARKGKSFTKSFLPFYLGRLGAKEEPGKVRVFAMVDWWTQMLLRPIHMMLFGLLKNIAQDATFDQDRGVQMGIRLLKKNGVAYSYDLSAATDRLPILIQKLLIEYLIPGASESWAKILVGREYQTPKAHRCLGMKIPEAVTYVVGQPMGALSSWAMLALTHHFIVQFAAWKEGWPKWFSDYLVLGDDIVIFNSKVAQRYLLIMKDLGVGINLVKSVVSKDTFEFAKRIIHKDSNLSPASFKELDVASLSLEGALILFNKFNVEWTAAAFVKYRGYGYKALSMLQHDFADLAMHLKNLLVFIRIPGLNGLSCETWWDWLNLKSLNQVRNPSTEELQSMMDKLLLLFKGTYPEHVRGDPIFEVYNKDTEGAVWSYINKCYVVSRREGGTIWSKTGIAQLPNWRAEELELMLGYLTNPIESNWEAFTKEVIADRVELEKFVDTVTMSREWTEMFIGKFIEWDSKASLDPTTLDFNTNKSLFVPKKRIGRWLKWHSAIRTK